jgi:hypothetical protein
MTESDLFKPVADFFEKDGYSVKGEIKDADLIAVKNEHIIAVELKIKPGLKLLLQAAERTKSCDEVYIALPAADSKAEITLLKKFGNLLSMAGIGLIGVAVKRRLGGCRILLNPRQTGPISPKERKKILTEFNKRLNNLSKGGMPGGKAITRYREEALLTAWLLNQLQTGQIRQATEKQTTAASLKENGAPENCYSILSSNHYGWFNKTARGKYELTEAGFEALSEYKEALKLILSQNKQET